jgi:hypothetical protein
MWKAAWQFSPAEAGPYTGAAEAGPYKRLGD